MNFQSSWNSQKGKILVFNYSLKRKPARKKILSRRMNPGSKRTKSSLKKTIKRSKLLSDLSNMKTEWQRKSNHIKREKTTFKLSCSCSQNKIKNSSNWFPQIMKRSFLLKSRIKNQQLASLSLRENSRTKKIKPFNDSKTILIL